MFGSPCIRMAWEDRVARELGKPYYKVVMEDFEEVHRRDIKYHPDEFVAANMSKKETGRISKLATDMPLGNEAYRADPSQESTE
jgi:hypothetical protein